MAGPRCDPHPARVVRGPAVILRSDPGLETALSLIREALPKKLRETAYAVAVEVAAADLNVRPEELRFLDMLRDRLDLDKLTIAAIERGIRARNIVR